MFYCCHLFVFQTLIALGGSHCQTWLFMPIAPLWGEEQLLSNCELSSKQDRSVNTEVDPQSLSSSCGQTNVEGIWTEVQSHAECLEQSQSSLLPELPSGSALVTSSRLRACDVLPPPYLTSLGLSELGSSQEGKKPRTSHVKEVKTVVG